MPINSPTKLALRRSKFLLVNTLRRHLACRHEWVIVDEADFLAHYARARARVLVQKLAAAANFTKVRLMALPYPVPANEAERLHTLRAYKILDTKPEERFDELTRLAALICGVPISLISLIDSDRQWFKSKFGLDLRETPRAQAFCTHAIMQPELFVVPDASKDERFANNPLVTGDLHIRFYAGEPLAARDGHVLGTLCVIDRVPHTLTDAQKEALRIVGQLVIANFELRRDLQELRQELGRDASVAGSGANLDEIISRLQGMASDLQAVRAGKAPTP